MEAQPSSRYYSHSRKRMFTGSGSGSGSSAFMDEDVVEIPPPPYSKLKALKQKEVICPEIINVDSDEDADDLMIIGENSVPSKDKLLSNGALSPTYNISSGDESGYDMAFNEIYSDLNGFMSDNDLAMLQAHFDSVDMPTGVEAPVPWWPSSKIGNDPVVSSSLPSPSTSGSPLNSGASKGYDKRAKLQTLSFTPFTSELLNFPTESGGHVSSFGNQAHMAPEPPVGFHGQNNLSGWVGYNMLPSVPVTQHPYNFNIGSAAPSWVYPSSTSNADIGKQLKAPSFTPPLPYYGGEKPKTFPSPPSPLFPWSSTSTASGGFSYKDSAVALDHKIAAEILVPEYVSAGQGDEIESRILGKLQAFKKFDTVEDPSAHYYAKNKDNSKQPSKAWVKKIQEEWRILENDLPDTIFVRVYETRMDLLRAVIIGAEGTPYHDGLYFFDVYFPSSYPKTPPLVHYHSRGLRLNPNLYNCGKVCLSLLNTWNGRGNEKWISGVSTALQVLVSIQGLILNSKPYFNEPGYEGTMGTPSGQKRSEEYNEKTYLLALKTMLYTMRQPPQPFEELVFGHFFKHAHDILTVCRAYLDGAPVGSLVNGKVLDVDKDRSRSCSQLFKTSLPQYLKSLCEAFEKIGVKDVMKYSVPVNSIPLEMPSASRNPKTKTLKIK